MERGEVVVPKPRTTAPLWVYFGFKPKRMFKKKTKTKKKIDIFFNRDCFSDK